MKYLIIAFFLMALCSILTTGYTAVDEVGEVGRYLCSTNGEWVTVIDTQTGHIWQMSKSCTVDWGTPQDRDYRETFIRRGQ